MSLSGSWRELRPRPGLRLWLREEVAAEWSAGLPSAGRLTPSTGRGALLRASSPLGPVLVRTYRRGGLLRQVLPDLFLSPDRALREWRAVARLEPLGLAPAILGLEASGRILLRLRVAVAERVGARDLLRLAGAEPEALGDPALGSAIGLAVRAMHEAGLSHPDLNVGNVLVAPSGRVELIDFDGARLHEGAVPSGERRAQVLRACRSLDKWAPTSAMPARVRAAFLREAIEADLRRALLSSGRAQHARRRRAGRTGRPAPS